MSHDMSNEELQKLYNLGNKKIKKCKLKYTPHVQKRLTSRRKKSKNTASCT